MKLIDDEAKRLTTISQIGERGKVADLSTNLIRLNKTPSRSSLYNRYVELECDYCHKIFSRSLISIRRSKKAGCLHTLCSSQCVGFLTNKIRGRGSPFHYFFKTILKSRIKKGSDINIEYLNDLWEKQKGICPYTGIKMILPIKAVDRNRKKNLIMASLDRIDSNQGYIQGNVEFVCLGINYAKKFAFQARNDRFYQADKESLKLFLKNFLTFLQNPLNYKFSRSKTI